MVQLVPPAEAPQGARDFVLERLAVFRGDPRGQVVFLPTLVRRHGGRVAALHRRRVIAKVRRRRKGRVGRPVRGARGEDQLPAEVVQRRRQRHTPVVRLAQREAHLWLRERQMYAQVVQPRQLANGPAVQIQRVAAARPQLVDDGPGGAPKSAKGPRRGEALGGVDHWELEGDLIFDAGEEGREAVERVVQSSKVRGELGQLHGPQLLQRAPVEQSLGNSPK
mmetsp:Transcript_19553/g.66090  ORF Transcript_19553/g.66090 Transcript_19553/m.66090 type:complete len:222 (-) Transcript_19553:1315-1980(-)